ncbi:uncharacterized protein [Mytilus edulis]|uniref:uncharacterized protein n=1 Tax=Mytilus edulis TaxID=6550 RepID=UPI0039F00AB2
MFTYGHLQMKNLISINIVVVLALVYGTDDTVAVTAPVCSDCANVDHPWNCHKSVRCQANDVCYVNVFLHQGAVLYTLGCQRKQICLEFINHAGPNIGKRIADADFCFACCIDDMCTRITSCYQLRQQMNATMFQ